MSRHACTGIVAQNSEGGIVHGRTLDYTIKAAMTNITVVIDFTRNGTTQYTSIGYIGMPGFNTFVKPGVVSLSQDERDQGSIFVNWWDMFIRRRLSTFAAIREVAQEATSFDDAVDRITSFEFAADSYFILGGTRAGQGVVIARDRNSKHRKVWHLGDANATAHGNTTSRWYLVETNYDLDGRTGKHDNRRYPAERYMDARGPVGFDAAAMWGAVTNKDYNVTRGERPTYNNETVWSAVMEAAHPEGLRVVVHEGPGWQPPNPPKPHGQHM